MRRVGRAPLGMSLVVLLLLASSAVAVQARAGESVCEPPEPCGLADVARAAGFRAGVAVAADATPARLEAVQQHFTSVTAENAMKWPALAPSGPGEYEFTDSDALVSFAQTIGLSVRGHTLVWGKAAPPWLAGELAAAPDAGERLTTILRDHVATVVGRYRGSVDAWDVVNEPVAVLMGLTGELVLDAHVRPRLEDNAFSEALGVGYIAEAFLAARAADPEATLVLNEAFTFIDYTGPRGRFFLRLLDDLQADGVPIDAVGVQAHAFVGVPRAWEVRGFLESVASRGLTVEMTELDVSRLALLTYLLSGRGWLALLQGGTPAVHAEVVGIFADACVAVVACTGITVWGVDDGATWLDSFAPFSFFAPNDPLLLDRAQQPKPAYWTMVDAIASGAPRAEATASG